jgi:hypothetical protein
VAATASHPRPGQIPGQQGDDGGSRHHVPFLELRTERFWNAKDTGSKVGPVPMLGKPHHPAD